MQKPQKSWTRKEDHMVWGLFYCDGMTQKEIGERLGRTMNSVQRRLNRLREQNFCHSKK